MPIIADWGLVGTGIVGVKITLFMILIATLGIGLSAILAEKAVWALWRMWKGRPKKDKKTCGILIRLLKEGKIDAATFIDETRKLGLSEDDIQLLLRIIRRDLEVDAAVCA